MPLSIKLYCKTIDCLWHCKWSKYNSYNQIPIIHILIWFRDCTFPFRIFCGIVFYSFHPRNMPLYWLLKHYGKSNVMVLLKLATSSCASLLIKAVPFLPPYENTQTHAQTHAHIQAIFEKNILNSMWKKTCKIKILFTLFCICSVINNMLLFYCHQMTYTTWPHYSIHSCLSHHINSDSDIFSKRFCENALM